MSTAPTAESCSAVCAGSGSGRSRCPAGHRQGSERLARAGKEIPPHAIFRRASWSPAGPHGRRTPNRPGTFATGGRPARPRRDPVVRRSSGRPVGHNAIGITLDPFTHDVYTANYEDASASVIDGAVCNGSVTSGCDRAAPRPGRLRWPLPSALFSHRRADRQISRSAHSDHVDGSTSDSSSLGLAPGSPDIHETTGA